MKYDVFTDLDNTLIFSSRVPLPEEKMVVEYLDGKEQSYMTVKSFAFLKAFSNGRIVPVTTRSVEQFMRIRVMGEDIPCHYALVCNGGELLAGGEIDAEWEYETRSIAKEQIDYLVEMKPDMEDAAGASRLQFPSNMMAYYKCANPQNEAAKWESRVDDSKVSVYFDRRKVYLIPRAINKGAAIERFRSKFGNNEISIAAGDGKADISMLEKADYAILPDFLDSFVSSQCKILSESVPLSDTICNVLARLEKYEYAE